LLTPTNLSSAFLPLLRTIFLGANSEDQLILGRTIPFLCLLHQQPWLQPANITLHVFTYKLIDLFQLPNHWLYRF